MKVCRKCRHSKSNEIELYDFLVKGKKVWMGCPHEFQKLIKKVRADRGPANDKA